MMVATIFTLALGWSSCKDKDKDKDDVNTTTTVNTDSANAVNNAPVVVATDPALEKGVQDAVKDHPGVTATVNNGEITLSGTIEKEKWVKLNQTLMSLNPKKVNSESLTIK